MVLGVTGMGARLYRFVAAKKCTGLTRPARLNIFLNRHQLMNSEKPFMKYSPLLLIKPLVEGISFAF